MMQHIDALVGVKYTDSQTMAFRNDRTKEFYFDPTHGNFYSMKTLNHPEVALNNKVIYIFVTLMKGFV